MCAREKKKPQKTPTIFITFGFLHMCVCQTQPHTSTHTWVRGPAGTSELIRCVRIKCQPPCNCRDSARCFSPLLALRVSSFYWLYSQQWQNCVSMGDKFLCSGGNKPRVSPAEFSVNDISHWFLWTVSKVPPAPTRPNSPSSHPTFPCSSNRPSPLFLAIEPGSVAGFCSMWEVLKGQTRPVQRPPWLT